MNDASASRPRKSSLGARFLWALRRVTPETAVNSMAGTNRELFDAACSYGARMVVRDLAYDITCLAEHDRFGRDILIRNALRMAVQHRDAYCRERLDH